MYSHRGDFLRHLAQTSPAPMGLEVVAARGVRLKDVQGRWLYDLIGGISVCSLGHAHPIIQQAIKKQLRKFSHVMVYGEMVQGPQVLFAKKLSEFLPPPLDCVYFVNSGTEATEAAMKLAKRATGRPKIAAFHEAYHGSSQGALSLMGSEYFRGAYRPLLPGITTLHYEQKESLQQIDQSTAAVFFETVRAEAGTRPVSQEFLNALCARCRETGTLLVLDEIQTGLGRTGPMFSTSTLGFVPDMVLSAKALGGGMPIGALISSPQLMRHFSHAPILGHLTTFGGHPLSCAAGLAGLKFIAKEGLGEQAVAKEAAFRHYLNHSKIQGVFGRGLLLSLEFEREAFNFKVIEQCLKLGVVSDWFLFNAKSLRIAPPLIMTEKEIKKICGLILEAIDRVVEAERKETSG